MPCAVVGVYLDGFGELGEGHVHLASFVEFKGDVCHLFGVAPEVEFAFFEHVLPSAVC